MLRGFGFTKTKSVILSEICYIINCRCLQMLDTDVISVVSFLYDFEGLYCYISKVGVMGWNPTLGQSHCSPLTVFRELPRLIFPRMQSCDMILHPCNQQWLVIAIPSSLLLICNVLVLWDSAVDKVSILWLAMLCGVWRVGWYCYGTNIINKYWLNCCGGTYGWN